MYDGPARVVLTGQGGRDEGLCRKRIWQPLRAQDERRDISPHARGDFGPSPTGARKDAFTRGKAGELFTIQVRDDATSADRMLIAVLKHAGDLAASQSDVDRARCESTCSTVRLDALDQEFR